MKKFINFVKHESMYGLNTLATACIIAIILFYATIAGSIILAIVMHPTIVIPSAIAILFGYILYEYWKQK